MNNVASYLLANAFSSFSPALNTAAAVCSVNGQQVACPQFINTLGPVISIAIIVLIAIMIASLWKIYTKAGQPGWASIIPIYSTVVMLKIAKKPV